MFKQWPLFLIPSIGLGIFYVLVGVALKAWALLMLIRTRYSHDPSWGALNPRSIKNPRSVKTQHLSALLSDDIASTQGRARALELTVSISEIYKRGSRTRAIRGVLMYLGLVWYQKHREWKVPDGIRLVAALFLIDSRCVCQISIACTLEPSNIHIVQLIA